MIILVCSPTLTPLQWYTCNKLLLIKQIARSDNHFVTFLTLTPLQSQETIQVEWLLLLQLKLVVTLLQPILLLLYVRGAAMSAFDNIQRLTSRCFGKPLNVECRLGLHRNSSISLQRCSSRHDVSLPGSLMLRLPCCCSWSSGTATSRNRSRAASRLFWFGGRRAGTYNATQ